MLRPERRPMDQKTPLHHEETVRFTYFARCNSAIERLSIAPNHLRKFRCRQVLICCGRCGPGLSLLPAHNRLSSRYSDALLSMSFLLAGGEHYRNLGASTLSAPDQVLCRAALPTLMRLAMFSVVTRAIAAAMLTSEAASVSCTRIRLQSQGDRTGIYLRRCV